MPKEPSKGLYVELLHPFRVTIDGEALPRGERRKAIGQPEQWLIARLLLAEGEELTYEQIERDLWNASKDNHNVRESVPKLRQLISNDTGGRTEEAFLKAPGRRREVETTIYKLQDKEGEEVLRLWNPTKSSICLTLSRRQAVDALAMYDNAESDDAETLLRFYHDCDDQDLFKGIETAFAKAQRKKYKDVRERLWQNYVRIASTSAYAAAVRDAFLPSLAEERADAGIGRDADIADRRETPRHDLSLLSEVDPHSPSTIRLPMPPSSFVGRGQEVQELSRRLTGIGERLVTLTGPGGWGKTRLALAAAWASAGNGGELFPSAYFCDFASVKEVVEIYDYLAQRVAGPAGSVQDPLEQLSEEIQGQRTLLLLDNFEALAPTGGPYVLRLLERLPNLTCLVTARQSLGLGAAEWTHPVEPLPVPDVLPSGAELAPDFDIASVQNGSPCLTLFVERAAAAHGFALTARNVRDVIGLCRYLDGIPLALELAAARSRTLMPLEMLTEIPRFELLNSRDENTDPRHKSLSAVIAWSFEALDPRTRFVFIRLSVFPGSFDVAVAAAVCLDGAVRDRLDVMVRAGLLLVDRSAADLRFRMLQTLRDFGSERLAGSEPAELAERHARHFAAWLDANESVSDAWQENIALEHDNIRAALRWCLQEEGRGPLALAIVSKSARFWHIRGYLTEGRHWIEAALPSAQGTIEERASLLRWAGTFAARQGDYDAALNYFGEGSDRLAGQGDPMLRASILNGIGNVYAGKNEYSPARSAMEESAAIYRQVRHPLALAQALMNLGNVAEKQGDYEAARQHHQESLAIRLAERRNPRWQHLYGQLDSEIGVSLMNMGNLSLAKGEPSKARKLYEESFQWPLAHHDYYSMAMTRHNQGVAAMFGEDDADARTYLQDSIGWRLDLGDQAGLSSSRCSLALLDFCAADWPAAISGAVLSLTISKKIGDRETIAECLKLTRRLAGKYRQYSWAVRLWGAYDQLLADTGLKDLNIPREVAFDEELAMAAREAVGADQCAELRQAGRNQSLPAVVDEALQRLPMLPYASSEGELN